MSRDEFVRYKKQAMEKRILWDDWVEKHECINNNKPHSYYALMKKAWHEGYAIGEGSLNELLEQ